MKIIGQVLLFLFSSSLFAIETLKTIPLDFQGKWAPSLKECGVHPLTQDVYPSLMTIHDVKVSYYESVGKVASIVRRNVNEIAMIIEFSGGGDKWLAFEHFILSDDKETLSDASNPRKKRIVYRCSNERKDV